MKPYSVSRRLAESIVDCESFAKLTWKFMYPAPAGATRSISDDFDVSMIWVKLFASSKGFPPVSLASSKHSEEASWPKSGFGGLANARFAALASGNVWLRAFAKVFSHSLRKVAKGFSEVINRFSSIVRIV